MPQIIPTWTGFNITIKDNVPILKSTIRYIYSFDSPAIDIVAIYEILGRCLNIKERLKPPVFICVFDRVIYAKAVEIKWKETEKFDNLMMMLGI